MMIWTVECQMSLVARSPARSISVSMLSTYLQIHSRMFSEDACDPFPGRLLKVPLIQAETSALLSGTALCCQALHFAGATAVADCKIPRWRSESWAGTIPLQVWVEALRQHCCLEDELLTHAKLSAL